MIHAEMMMTYLGLRYLDYVMDITAVSVKKIEAKDELV